ncbi:unnamed protein product [Brassicogethes aeneus]|uniref:Uncharacterized protein n=1 Tax=Brassicogethes aeneus TaxID=1431903 RepID=A0A9P0ARY8_BRAAE|nr:unnamed protein product [Brassicogethes aeneus]
METDLQYFKGLYKRPIFDVFNQLITTGFVLNTGYWCFFSTFKGQCLCVCGRYGTYCRHIRNPHHWIDMEPIDAKENDYTFYPKYFGSICPTDYNVAIEPINEYQPGYHIIINLTVEYKKLGRGRPRRTDKDKPTTFDPRNAKQKFETAIYAR